MRVATQIVYCLFITCTVLLPAACSHSQQPNTPKARGTFDPAGPGNLLRNGDFTDDWITLLPETKNHHWAYSSEFYNRRDFNPDSWFCKGNWQWLDEDAPIPQSSLVLAGPAAEAVQRVNWVTVHDDRAREGFPDAGGFPVIKVQRSPAPERLVRDLRFSVRIQGTDVPADAGSIELALCPPGGISSSDPMGTHVAPTIVASTPLPVGTFGWQTIEVKLTAADWLKAARDAAAKDPKEAGVVATDGLTLPGTVSVAIRYKAAAGQIEVSRAELLEPGAAAPNLMPDGGFESVDAGGYPTGWGRQEKYRYFPPGYYYIFNTWHNGSFGNRGPVGVDRLVTRRGSRSLKMIVAAGDEKAVTSQPVTLNQKEPRLIEVSAWVKTNRLCMLQIDAHNEKGERLDGFNFINKAPTSIGTNAWRLVRQVFRPRTPVQALHLKLCARGVNGYTLDDTGPQPQNNVVGTIWWDDVKVFEPETPAEELVARGATPVGDTSSGLAQQRATAPKNMPQLANLDFGEQMIGANTVTGVFINPGPARSLAVQWELTAPSGKKSVFKARPQRIAADSTPPLMLHYDIAEPCPDAYTQYRGVLTLLDEKARPITTEEYWFGVWTTPIDLELGSLYVQPDQKLFVRMNLGLSIASLQQLSSVRLEVVRRSGGQVIHTQQVPATPAAIVAQRARIPVDLREDFTSMLLADLDVSALPVQPFNDPQRNWYVRATAQGAGGKPVAVAQSSAFCRQAHEPAQPAIESVRIDTDNLLYVNNQPWMPWGVIYGHVPVYAGPADPGAGQYRDLKNLPGWSIYDRFTAATYNRKVYDFNTLRYVAGSISDRSVLEKKWLEDNLYASSAFVVPDPVYSMQELVAKAGGKEKLDAYLSFVKNGAMVVSTAPGVEEVFGAFHAASPEQLKGMGEVVGYLRQTTGKPVMVAHGGYWNRFEFEKVPYYDIYDPETEPFFPANLHTDLQPLIKGQAKTIWLRPQMYEDVPYERWRFHVYTELMRGARGWQIAHGPGDPSLFRGLHGEMEFMKPIVYSKKPAPAVKIEPAIEHLVRRYNNKTYVVAATTHGVALGDWSHSTDHKAPHAGALRSRVTGAAAAPVGPTAPVGSTDKPSPGQTVDPDYKIHGIQNLPDARAWPDGSKLVQWVRLDAQAMPQNLAILVSNDSRWKHAAAWGKFDLEKIRTDPKLGYWFLRNFYKNHAGFLGWNPATNPAYIPRQTTEMGALPVAGQWIKLEISLDQLGATGATLDGIGFLHDGGRVYWGQTSIVAADGAESVVWGNSLELPPAQLAATRIHVAGLKAGTRVRVLFEDRELIAAAGHFTDDFRGHDLYQRFGGGPGHGYGDAPVALHVYEIE